MYQFTYRHALRHFDAETLHTLAITVLAVAGRSPLRPMLARRFTPPVDPSLPSLAVQTLGLRFTHPLGLAAGFDKEGRCIPAMHALGFSFTEVGTITPRPQPGNPRPRLYRLIEDQALINRMGFPGHGAAGVSQNLRDSQPYPYPVLVSLGKNKPTPLAESLQDYAAVLRMVYDLADGFSVNVSSPNTPDLRKLQDAGALRALLEGIATTAHDLAHGQPIKPLLIKIAPDLTWDAIDQITAIAIKSGFRGIIATNTTLDRTGLRSSHRTESGGLSGSPLRTRSTDVIRHLYRTIGDQLCIIGVGGVFSGDDLWDKIAAGATLVQAYTGFIYQGPTFVRTAIGQFQARLLAEGRTLADLRGSDAGAR